MDAKGDEGVGTTIHVESYQNIVVAISTNGVGGGEAVTIKALGSISENAPDFSSAKAHDNHYEYIQVIDYEDNTGIDGNTGITASGANVVRLVQFNVDGLKWVNFELSSITGTLEVYIVGEMYGNE